MAEDALKLGEKGNKQLPLLSAEKRRLAGCVGGSTAGTQLAGADAIGSTGKSQR